VKGIGGEGRVGMSPCNWGLWIRLLKRGGKGERQGGLERPGTSFFHFKHWVIPRFVLRGSTHASWLQDTTATDYDEDFVYFLYFRPKMYKNWQHSYSPAVFSQKRHFFSQIGSCFIFIL